MTDVGFGGAIFGSTTGDFQYGVAAADNSDATAYVSGAVVGESLNHAGVSGLSPGTGAGAVGVYAYGSKPGLKTTADDTNAKNVAIWAAGGETSTALAVDGKFRLKEAGLVNVAAGYSSVTVSLSGFDTNAMGFAMV